MFIRGLQDVMSNNIIGIKICKLSQFKELVTLLAFVVRLANYLPNLDLAIITRGSQDSLLGRVPCHAVNVLGVSVLQVTHELVAVLGLHLEQPDAVVSAGRRDEAALMAPVDVVGTPLVIASQGRYALPGGIVSVRVDALLVP